MSSYPDRPVQQFGPAPGPPAAFGFNTGYIEELALPYDPTQQQAVVKRRWRLVRGRIISIILTVVILLGIYFWQRASFPPGVWVLYGIVFGISLLWLAVYVIGYVQAKRDLASMGQGIALRIGRAGVVVAADFAPWTQISALRVVNGKLGRGPRFRMEYVSEQGPRVAEIAMNQIEVFPATLDTTARAYSAGRQGVDLSALDA